MAQPQKEKLVKVLLVAKDSSDDTWAAAYGFKAYEIPLSVLEKNGKITEQNNPDVLQIFESQVIGWVKTQFGL